MGHYGTEVSFDFVHAIRFSLFVGSDSETKKSGGSGFPWKTAIWAFIALVAMFMFKDQLGDLISRVTGITIGKDGVKIVTQLEEATEDIPLTVADASSATIPDSVSRKVLALRDSIDPEVLRTRPDLMLKIGVVEQLKGDTAKARILFEQAKTNATITGDTKVIKAADKNLPARVTDLR